MNKVEAIALLSDQLAVWRSRSYSTLVAEVGKCSHLEIVGRSGARYQVEIQAVWDDKPEGNVRVLGSIDDGGMRAFAPLSEDFIMAPDGSLVDEAV